jgi:hypothetical protein
VKVGDLSFGTCDFEKFRDWNRLWHSQLPEVGSSRGRVYYSADHEGRCYAVAMWSNPVARKLPQREWMELRRFAIHDDRPPNTASWMLGHMARDIQRRFPEVVRLISYQDVDAHSGYIYRAAGWEHAKNYKYNTPKVGWGSRKRAGSTNQPVKQRMRWEKHLPSPTR